MNYEEYVKEQAAALIGLDEKINYVGGVVQKPNVVLMIPVLGPVMAGWLLTKGYFLVITSNRVILILTKYSFFSGKLELANLGNRQYQRGDIKGFKISGASLTLELGGRRSEKFEVSPPLSKNILNVNLGERRAEVRDHVQRITNSLQQLAKQF